MEVSFDLEDGVHPEDSLFDGIHLTIHDQGDAVSDAMSDAESVASFASQSEVASDSDLECFGDCVPEGVLFKE